MFFFTSRVCQYVSVKDQDLESFKLSPELNVDLWLIVTYFMASDWSTCNSWTDLAESWFELESANSVHSQLSMDGRRVYCDICNWTGLTNTDIAAFQNQFRIRLRPIGKCKNALLEQVFYFGIVGFINPINYRLKNDVIHEGQMSLNGGCLFKLLRVLQKYFFQMGCTLCLLQ